MNWLCINNGVVENVIVADTKFVQTNKDVLEKYQSIISQDDFPDPKPQIGSRLVNGKWIIKDVPIVAGTDFSGQDLTGRDFRHYDLTGCKFIGSKIDGCKFEWVKPNFSLAGAIWQNKTIKQGPVMLDNPYYYTIITDIVAFVGCTECDTGLPLVSSDEGKNSWDSKGDQPAKWWAFVKDAYTNQVNLWSK